MSLLFSSLQLADKLVQILGLINCSAPGSAEHAKAHGEIDVHGAIDVHRSQQMAYDYMYNTVGINQILFLFFPLVALREALAVLCLPRGPRDMQNQICRDFRARCNGR